MWFWHGAQECGHNIGHLNSPVPSIRGKSTLTDTYGYDTNTTVPGTRYSTVLVLQYSTTVYHTYRYSYDIIIFTVYHIKPYTEV
jgi:hypothetical protein